LFLIGVSGFTFSQESGGKSIKITGIDSRYASYDGYLTNNAVADGNAICVMLGIMRNFSINNGTILTGFGRYLYDQNWTNERLEYWNGDGSYFIVLVLNDMVNWKIDTYVSKVKISFVNNITETPFSNFNFISSRGLQ